MDNSRLPLIEKFEKLDKTVETKRIVDENVIMDIVDKHLRRQLNGRTSESIGM